MQVKQGFRAIGYINNNSTYLNDIRRLCGDMVSYPEIDQFVSQQWAQKETACPCWDKDLQPTLSSNGDACYFIINTGYVTQDSGIPIYGGFCFCMEFLTQSSILLPQVLECLEILSFIAASPDPSFGRTSLNQLGHTFSHLCGQKIAVRPVPA